MPIPWHVIIPAAISAGTSFLGGNAQADAAEEAAAVQAQAAREALALERERYYTGLANTQPFINNALRGTSRLNTFMFGDPAFAGFNSVYDNGLVPGDMSAPTGPTTGAPGPGPAVTGGTQLPNGQIVGGTPVPGTQTRQPWQIYLEETDPSAGEYYYNTLNPRWRHKAFPWGEHVDRSYDFNSNDRLDADEFASWHYANEGQPFGLTWPTAPTAGSTPTAPTSTPAPATTPPQSLINVGSGRYMPGGGPIKNMSNVLEAEVGAGQGATNPAGLPSTQAEAEAEFYSNPLFKIADQYFQNTLQPNLEKSLSASGGFNSGRAQGGLARAGADYISQNAIMPYINLLMGQTTQPNMSSAPSGAEYAAGAGTARGAGILNAGLSRNDLYSSIGSILGDAAGQIDWGSIFGNKSGGGSSSGFTPGWFNQGASSFGY